MSNYWDVWCMDCESWHGFVNANHQSGLMAKIASEGIALSLMAPTVRRLREAGHEANFFVESHRYQINFDWFAQHGSHRIVAMDEAGVIFGECGRSYKCCDCGTWRICHRKEGHEGDCDTNRDAGT